VGGTCWVFCPGETLDAALQAWAERTHWDPRAVRDFLTSPEAGEHGLRMTTQGEMTDGDRTLST